MEKRNFVVELNNGIKYCGFGKKVFGPLGNMGIKFDYVFSVNRTDSDIISKPKKTNFIFPINEDDLIWPIKQGNVYIDTMINKFGLNIG